MCEQVLVQSGLGMCEQVLVQSGLGMCEQVLVQSDGDVRERRSSQRGLGDVRAVWFRVDWRCARGFGSEWTGGCARRFGSGSGWPSACNKLTDGMWTRGGGETSSR
ncbi:hypothetical protein HNY73_015237 [Argiope bruennichi]|uniref:Uncharacterized protein n=1 Tax=Argiope bruennichi TaxID=94029 RepID=A0A8T0ERG8_ARGBR|nr:hypothetical protein HNY73_015237 [Argiope bruennichi]